MIIRSKYTQEFHFLLEKEYQRLVVLVDGIPDTPDRPRSKITQCRIFGKVIDKGCYVRDVSLPDETVECDFGVRRSIANLVMKYVEDSQIPVTGKGWRDYYFDFTTKEQDNYHDVRLFFHEWINWEGKLCVTGRCWLKPYEDFIWGDLVNVDVVSYTSLLNWSLRFLKDFDFTPYI